MSVTSEQSSVSYVGNNSNVSAYPVPFVFLLPSDLGVAVTLRATGAVTTLTYGSQFTVTGGNGATGAVVTTAAWPGTYDVEVFRDLPLIQPAVFEEGQRIPMKALERAFDRVVMQLQRVRAGISGFISDLAAHIERSDNPHAVTKEQVGLGSVNNTSDEDKPISTATQTALAQKADTSALAGLATLGTPQTFTAKKTFQGNLVMGDAARIEGSLIPYFNDGFDPGYLGTDTLPWTFAYLQGAQVSNFYGQTMAGTELDIADLTVYSNLVVNETVYAYFAPTSLAQFDGSVMTDDLTINGLVINNATTVSYSPSSRTAHILALGLENVNNTSDLNKPVSTATQTALNNKATLTGSNVFNGGTQTFDSTAAAGNLVTIRAGNTSYNGNLLAITRATGGPDAALFLVDKTGLVSAGSFSGNGLTITGTTNLSTTVVSGSVFPPLKAERTSTATNTTASALLVTQSTSNNAADGFGASLNFGITDNGVTDSLIGAIGVERSGADNSGRMRISVRSSGIIIDSLVIEPTGSAAFQYALSAASLSVPGTSTFGSVSVSSTSFPPLDVTRTTGGTAGTLGVARFNVTSTGDMVDGLAAQVSFTGSDTGGAGFTWGVVGGVRAGNDTTGDLYLGTALSGVINEVMRLKSTGNVLIGTATDPGTSKLYVNGGIGSKPPSSVTPANNGDMVFELTSNTSITIKVKGSDGVVRKTTLTLAP